MFGWKLWANKQGDRIADHGAIRGRQEHYESDKPYRLPLFARGVAFFNGFANAGDPIGPIVVLDRSGYGRCPATLTLAVRRDETQLITHPVLIGTQTGTGYRAVNELIFAMGPAPAI